MALAVRQQIVVDQNHVIHLQSSELKPGSRVDNCAGGERGAAS